MQYILKNSGSPTPPTTDMCGYRSAEQPKIYRGFGNYLMFVFSYYYFGYVTVLESHPSIAATRLDGLARQILLHFIEPFWQYKKMGAI